MSELQAPDPHKADIDAIREAIRRFEERWGLNDEELARDLMTNFLQSKGWSVLKSSLIRFGRQELVALVVDADGRVVTMAVQVVGRMRNQSSLAPLLDAIRQPDFVATLRREGFPEPIVPAAFALLVYWGAEEAARQAGVGLFSPRGELVAPPLDA